ncbi:MAG TPA: acyl-CoA dehydrogenase family protein [Xanthobacteraceae bacterium]|jgi:alkylation response protein AidB-like acyl-CoA dehydrogenase|nr:acyl-CoA dehydrogenase family protein [Xanthobacteraceae bacterium]
MISPARPEVSELLARARDIAALARARALETEAARRVGEDIITRMRQADLFRVLQPLAYGGFEYGFDVFAEIEAVLAAGCGSTGWVYGLLASHQWLIACFSQTAQDEVWSDRNALAAGTYAPVAQAETVEGGYLVSGAGSFCSGCDNAQWQFLGGMIPQSGGPPQPGFFLLRSSDITIDDNWRTMGLCGTGSKAIVADKAFVPAHRALSFAELIAARAPGMRAHANPLYKQSFLAVLPITIVVPVLGMAEGALAIFLDMAKGRTTRGAVTGGNRKMAELTTVQLRAAEAAALIDAARLMIFRDLVEAFAAAARGEAISVDMRLRNRRDQAFCVRLSVQAIDALFLAAGGQGLFLDHPLQRFWRDAHAAGSHISLNWDSAGSMFGQYLLGLEPKGQY